MSVFIIFLYILFSLIAILLTFMILIQDDQGDGIGGLFGGGSASTFGTRSGNVLTRFTGILAGLFIAVCFILGLMNRSPNLGEIKEEKQTPENVFFAPIEKDRLERAEASADAASSGETGTQDQGILDSLSKPFGGPGPLPPSP